MPPGQDIRLERRCRFWTGTRLRSIGIRDYSVFEGRQRIGRIRFAGEHTPGVWLWNVIVHLTGGLPMGSASTRPRPSSRRLGKH